MAKVARQMVEEAGLDVDELLDTRWLDWVLRLG